MPPQVQASAMLLLLTMKVKDMELGRFLKIGRFIPQFNSGHPTSPQLLSKRVGTVTSAITHVWLTRTGYNAMDE